ncbi:MAG: PTS sugar transporter subunit IIB, partial [Cetobacterium sp.]
CSQGMSTSLLVTKMKNAAKEKGIEVEIEASSVEKFLDKLSYYDIFLLGPQVRFRQQELHKVASEQNKRVEVINMMDYGTMNGKKVLEEALKAIG